MCIVHCSPFSQVFPIIQLSRFRGLGTKLDENETCFRTQSKKTIFFAAIHFILVFLLPPGCMPEVDTFCLLTLLRRESGASLCFFFFFCKLFGSKNSCCYIFCSARLLLSRCLQSSTPVSCSGRLQGSLLAVQSFRNCGGQCGNSISSILAGTYGLKESYSSQAISSTTTHETFDLYVHFVSSKCLKTAYRASTTMVASKTSFFFLAWPQCMTTRCEL
jgi:hypothetical protein